MLHFLHPDVQGHRRDDRGALVPDLLLDGPESDGGATLEVDRARDATVAT